MPLYPPVTNEDEKQFNNLGGGMPDYPLGTLLKCLSEQTPIQFTALFQEKDFVTTTSVTPVDMIDATTSVIADGVYAVIGFYGWNKNNQANDFEAVLSVDGITIDPDTGYEYMFQRQEPKDSSGASYPAGSSSGTNQSQFQTFVRVIPLTEAAHNLKLSFNSGNAGNATTMWNAGLMLVRLS